VVLHFAFWEHASLLSTVAIMAVARSVGAIAVIVYCVAVTATDGRSLIAQAFVKPILTCCAVSGIGLVWATHLQADTWLSLFVAVGTLEALFLAVSACWCLDREEKGLTMQLVRQAVTALSH
jgi:hypothetical protein